jgi:HlyD family secretion protein
VDIDVAEATVLLAKIQLDKAQKDFKPWEKKPADNPIRASLYNKLVAAQKNYDSAVRRLNNLKGQGVNADERELAQADLDLAQANLAEAVRKLEELKAGPQAGDIQVLEARIQAAEATLRTRQLRALFTATVTDILVMPGDQVSPGKAAFRLDDLSRLVVDVLISEVDINRIQVGQEVVLTFDAILGKEYSGQVTEVSRVGASTQGLVEFKVSVQLIDPDETVRPGMTAAVNIVINELDDVLLVPNRAVRVLEGKRVVYLLVDSELEPVEITLGASSETFSEVTDGELKPGDIIVLNPPTEFESDGPPPFVR